MWCGRSCRCGVLCLALQLAAGAEEGTCKLPGGGVDAACAAKGKRGGRVDWDKFDRDGYVVIPRVLKPWQIAQAKAAYASSEDNGHGFRQAGHALEKDPIFPQLLQALPKELEDRIYRILGPWVASSFSYVKLQPMPESERPRNFSDRERLLTLHADYPYGHYRCGWRHIGNIPGCLNRVPPQYPDPLQVIFMIDDFTEQNGGTLILPGSHRGNRSMPRRTPDALKYFNENAVTASGKAGDVLLYVATMLHCHGINVDVKERAAVLMNAVPFFVKPLHGFSHKLPNRIARTLSPKVRNRLGLVGYSTFKHTGQLGNGLPTPLQDGAKMLWDALRYGYPSRAITSVRWYSLAALVAPLLLCLGCRFGEALKLLLAVSLGLLLGVSMVLDKFYLL